jgi:hypothetical protein
MYSPYYSKFPIQLRPDRGDSVLKGFGIMSNSKQGQIHPLLLQTLKQDNIDNYFLIL